MMIACILAIFAEISYISRLKGLDWKFHCSIYDVKIFIRLKSILYLDHYKKFSFWNFFELLIIAVNFDFLSIHLKDITCRSV